MTVYCNAIVDETEDSYRVKVTGRPPFAYSRVYDIVAATGDAAAYEGMRRFIAEAEGDTHGRTGARSEPQPPST